MAETPTLTDRSVERERMIAAQVARRGVTDARVLEAMRQVPREVFVHQGMEEFAYEDSPLPIAEGQTISQPYIVALMIEAAQIKPSDRVLDVGTGSGYAAAVLSRLAAKVYSIERHRDLADSARRALSKLKYDNVEVRHGDGTLGWPDAAPFDAILVAAGGPEVPEALRSQLKIGGRLIIPIGELGGTQELVKVVRDGEDRYHEEDLGPVTFVPLIGASGWAESTMDAAPASSRLWPRRPARTACSISNGTPPRSSRAVCPIWTILPSGQCLTALLMHGSCCSAKQPTEHPSSIARAHRSPAGSSNGTDSISSRSRRIGRMRRASIAMCGTSPSMSVAARRSGAFPQWMWRNVEVANFVDWLRAHNAALHPDEHTGFFGLDIYNMNASISAVVEYLERFDPEAAQVARERYGCLTPWQRDPATYGRAALTTGYAKCEAPVLLALHDLLAKQLEYEAQDRDSFLDAAQNARLIASAERYYRAMYYATAESWNLRDRHMFETLNHLMDWRGKNAKAIVWAHNSHIGNAAATDMGKTRDEINIGQLCREKFGD